MPTTNVSRRAWLAAAAGGAVTLLVGRRALASPLVYAGPSITIYKSKSCGCCAKWVDHVRAAGFSTTVHDTEGMDAIKRQYGVPAALQSCHTGLLAGYVVEGHVPAADLLRLLREKPANVRGLAAPGMPQGSPGMETGQVDRFDVIAFSANGATRVYAKH